MRRAARRPAADRDLRHGRQQGRRHPVHLGALRPRPPARLQAVGVQRPVASRDAEAGRDRHAKKATKKAKAKKKAAAKKRRPPPGSSPDHARRGRDGPGATLGRTAGMADQRPSPTTPRTRASRRPAPAATRRATPGGTEGDDAGRPGRAAASPTRRARRPTRRPIATHSTGDPTPPADGRGACGASLPARLGRCRRAHLRQGRLRGAGSDRAGRRRNRAARPRATRVAQAQGIPLKFLENILADMRHAGLVTSRRGAEGGYWLARPAEEITVADIIRAVEGPLASVRGGRPEDVDYAGTAEPLQRGLDRRAREPALASSRTSRSPTSPPASCPRTSRPSRRTPRPG